MARKANARKKAAYFGPFTDAKLLREAINLVNALFPVRKCQRLHKTACLYYHIGQCLAPCIKPEVKPEPAKPTKIDPTSPEYKQAQKDRVALQKEQQKFQQELQADWDRAKALEPLQKIDPLA